MALFLLNKKLSANGLPRLGELDSAFSKLVTFEERKSFMRKVAELTLGKSFTRTEETSPLTPDEYLFYTEAAPLMASKFFRTSMKWIDKNLD